MENIKTGNVSRSIPPLVSAHSVSIHPLLSVHTAQQGEQDPLWPLWTLWLWDCFSLIQLRQECLAYGIFSPTQLTSSSAAAPLQDCTVWSARGVCWQQGYRATWKIPVGITFMNHLQKTHLQMKSTFSWRAFHQSEVTWIHWWGELWRTLRIQFFSVQLCYEICMDCFPGGECSNLGASVWLTDNPAGAGWVGRLCASNGHRRDCPSDCHYGPIRSGLRETHWLEHFKNSEIMQI